MCSVNENSLHSHLMEKKSGMMGQPYEREKKIRVPISSFESAVKKCILF